MRLVSGRPPFVVVPLPFSLSLLLPFSLARQLLYLSVLLLLLAFFQPLLASAVRVEPVVPSAAFAERLGYIERHPKKKNQQTIKRQK